MSLVIKQRGRPPKPKNVPVAVVRTDDELLSDIKERFDILSILTKGAIAGNVRSVIVSGAPGVGKSHLVYGITSSHPNIEHISGKVSPVHVYKAGYRMRHKGSVLVFDDVDNIFNDEDSLNVLKVLCDSSEYRNVSWLAESVALKDDTGDVPTTYQFEGSVIFITNLDIQHYITEGKNKYVPHFKALSSRSLYLDLMIHNRQQLGVWINHIAINGGMFKREGIDEALGNTFLKYIMDNKYKLRDLSLRTITKLVDIYRSHASNWERMANVLLLKN